MPGRFKPEYETAATRAKELEVCNRLAADGLHFQKLAPKDVLDFGISRDDQLVAFLEVKSTSYPSTKYRTFRMSMAKFLRMKTIHATTGRQTALVVCYTDKTLRLWINGTVAPEFLEMGGRWDRADSEDVEPLAHFPVEDFKELWTNGEGAT